jgi:hypothetical protein
MAAPLRVMRKTGHHGHFIGKQVIMVTLSENRPSAVQSCVCAVTTCVMTQVYFSKHAQNAQRKKEGKKAKPKTKWERLHTHVSSGASRLTVSETLC